MITILLGGGVALKNNLLDVAKKQQSRKYILSLQNLTRQKTSENKRLGQIIRDKDEEIERLKEIIRSKNDILIAETAKHISALKDIENKDAEISDYIITVSQLKSDIKDLSEHASRYDDIYNIVSKIRSIFRIPLQTSTSDQLDIMININRDYLILKRTVSEITSQYLPDYTRATDDIKCLLIKDWISKLYRSIREIVLTFPTLTECKPMVYKFDLTKIDVDEIIFDLNNNRKISAVKRLRECAKIGLREAKEYIDILISKSETITHDMFSV